MKLWFAAPLVGMLAIAGCGGSPSDSSATPSGASVTVTATATPRATPALSCGDKTCVPAAPTPTAPLSCGFGSGIWEQCAKTAIDPAFADYVTRFSIPTGEEQAVVIEERIDWPDSCLGVDTPGVLCLQVITPGFRFVVTAAPGRPYAEYHTDLNGHAVFVAEYATYQDVPPTHTPD
jgi:hypothetical protein